jgi:hypothetical protein
MTCSSLNVSFSLVFAEIFQYFAPVANIIGTDASWEKRKATATQRMNLWRCTRRMLVYTDDPKYHNASFGEVMQLDCETRPKYFEMEHVFWIRVS